MQIQIFLLEKVLILSQNVGRWPLSVFHFGFQTMKVKAYKTYPLD